MKSKTALLTADELRAALQARLKRDGVRKIAKLLYRDIGFVEFILSRGWSNGTLYRADLQDLERLGYRRVVQFEALEPVTATDDGEEVSEHERR